eukprot:scaffold240797_cov35-Tisochrysis_lutea.AAC.2
MHLVSTRAHLPHRREELLLELYTQRAPHRRRAWEGSCRQSDVCVTPRECRRTRTALVIRGRRVDVAVEIPKAAAPLLTPIHADMVQA